MGQVPKFMIPPLVSRRDSQQRREKPGMCRQHACVCQPGAGGGGEIPIYSLYVACRFHIKIMRLSNYRARKVKLVPGIMEEWGPVSSRFRSLEHLMLYKQENMGRLD